MKYFSPSILDGSVTTAKLADGAVDTAKLANFALVQQKIATSTTSQSGSIGIQGKVVVALTTHSFIPDIEADQPVSASLDTQVLANFQATPAANPGVPQFDLRNEDTGSARDYDVAWRHIDA